METLKDLIKKHNLDAAQVDDVRNNAIASIAEFLNGVDYEVLEDGINILSSEDTIIEVSQGNYDNVSKFEKEANERYLSAFEQEAMML